MKFILAVAALIFIHPLWAQNGLPDYRPAYMKLSSPGLTLYVDRALDAHALESNDRWRLTLGSWSSKQISFTGLCERADGTSELVVMTGTPQKGDDSVTLHAVILDGDHEEKRDFVLTWNQDETWWNLTHTL